MRIAYFSEVFLPKIDGVVNTLIHLLEYLEENDHESILLTPHSSVKRVSSTPIITYFSFPLILYPGYRGSFPSLKKTIQHLQDFQPDLIHLINPVYFNLAGLKAAQQLNIPIVASYQTDFPGYAKTLGLGFLAKPIWRFFRKIHNQADLNLAPSNTTRDQMIANGIHNVRVWRRGINMENFNPDKYDADMRGYLSGGEPEKPLLIYVGRLSPEKRVDWLYGLFEAGLDVRLAFIGDGPFRPYLELQFKDTPTVFTGFLSGEDLYKAYASADLFVFPSKNETLGNVVLEAMASGLPVITPTEGGQIDHVIHGKTGLLFDADDPDAMLAAVRYMLEHQEERQEMRQQAQEHVKTISWQAIFYQLIDDYECLLDNAPVQPETAGKENHTTAQKFSQKLAHLFQQRN
jgi:glycosyltransferase involved in cell wall biosynthesis